MRPRPTHQHLASALGIAFVLGLGSPAAATMPMARQAELTVLVGGVERPEYTQGGTTYVEALQGREYELRITNPYPVRVAVALAVDGLNTIDARRTDPWSASKWVLEPYGSMVVSGWQVGSSTARRFYFTNERNSYGAALGMTRNLGVIEAVFYREKERRPILRRIPPVYDREGAPAPQPGASLDGGAAEPRREKSSAAEARPASPPSASGSVVSPRPIPQETDDYAATGMGSRTRNDVETVSVDLESRPASQVRIRYEFRPQLVKLGILPREDDRLTRREGATGFERGWCPEPGGPRR